MSQPVPQPANAASVPNHEDLTRQLQKSFQRHVHLSLGKDQFSALRKDLFNGAALTIRDHLVDDWLTTLQDYYQQDVKRVYYLSLEFLMGRTLLNAVLNMHIGEPFRKALASAGYLLEELAEEEWDAGLGNGGLGRLAACYLDSMASTGIPGYGYGIRYEYGIFFQHIQDGYQLETPDNWLRYGNPWEFPRPELLYQVHFYGQVTAYQDQQGDLRYAWTHTESVMAMAYDTPVPGYNNGVVNTMRLWAAKSTREFDLDYFNSGDYIQAVAHKNESENISKVLYPNDNNLKGKELRLKQEYFFVSATLQDIIRRYLKTHDDFEALPDKVAIQLNDTHPAITIAELMRLLVDVYQLSWEQAWDLTTRSCAYTNHTILPEALETWSVELLGELLPRHLQIIYEINRRFLAQVAEVSDNPHLLKRVSLISESPVKTVRMAHLAIVGSHAVNGVSALHTEILKARLFPEFYSLWPQKFQNKTNGVTQRRWLNQCNPQLSAAISQRIGLDWLTDLSQLKRLLSEAYDARFLQQLGLIKQDNKQRLADYIRQHCQLEVNPQSLFDCQTKRMHEYKRQLMFTLYIATAYLRLKQGQPPAVPRTFIMSGKAAPGYREAKLLLKLYNAVGAVINQDPAAEPYFKVVFLPNYSVSLAEKIIPAADLSEQISTAGMEASGTGNMKYALNGALTIGTLDGANVEMSEEIGPEQMFIFGLRTPEVEALRLVYEPSQIWEQDPELRNCLEAIAEGFFSPEHPSLFQPVVHKLLTQDPYFVLADYRAYLEAQAEVDRCYLQPELWQQKVLHNIANMGKFSSDRAILEYAADIWGVEPTPGHGYRWDLS